jgi:tol-pal system protein YbgF
MRYPAFSIAALCIGGAAFASAGAASGSGAQPSVPPARVAAQPSDIQGQLKQLSERLASIEQQLQNQGVLALFNQIEELKAELARLRGQQEELAHSQQVAEKRVKDFYTELDGRLKTLAKPPANAPTATTPPVRPSEALAAEPATQRTAAPGPATGADPDAESKAYEAALGLLRESNHVAATKAFQAFLETYPNAPLASNALYWMGLSQFSQGELKAAVATQQKLLKDYPQSAKVPDAMVNLARAHNLMGEKDAGMRWLTKVIADFPVSKAAEVARKMQELNK